ncbi:MAG: sigma-70 family RNA polymerase sigma factor [Planctomycetes bacterium]|nr:sigma-70 family RNA polymerase sigma factor [Planctomycetota bacterium]
MTDEDRLVELLARHQAGDRSVEGDILELVDKYFCRALRPVVNKVFGTDVVGTEGPHRKDNQPEKDQNGKDSNTNQTETNRRQKDGDCRYTEMVNDFFVKVLDKKPDAFWKAKTAKNLRTWASVVIANQMRDVLRRQKKGQQILKEILPLIDQRQTHFQKQYQKDFEEFLDQLAAWDSSSDQRYREQATALRHRYVDGMSKREIQEQMGISDDKLNSYFEYAKKIFGRRE